MFFSSSSPSRQRSNNLDKIGKLARRACSVYVIAPIFFVAFAGVFGYYGFAKKDNAFDPLNYLTKTSPLREFVQVQQKYFGRIEGLEFYVVDEDLEDPQTLKAMCELDRRISGLSFVVTDTEKLPSWVSLYAKYYGCGCPFAELFGPDSPYLPCVLPGAETLAGKWTCDSVGVPEQVDSSKTCLKTYLALSDMSIDADGGGSSATTGMLRSGFRFKNTTRGNHDGKVDAVKIQVPVLLEKMYGFNTDVMYAARNISLATDDGDAALPLEVRSFAAEFLETERNVETYALAYQAVSSSMAAVFVVGLFFLSIPEALLIGTTVVLVVACIIGLFVRSFFLGGGCFFSEKGLGYPANCRRSYLMLLIAVAVAVAVVYVDVDAVIIISI